ncbi:response regulator [Sphingobium sufflavum]|uniref:response regulator n=1 Tax=Sphingobium sufflavum TaxID=1129547 RepID=UPI001F27DC74|nr:response regulator [Sphingobium sufflavum]MCE7798181.1 response regulator [Sphingobium sufflavum]
MSAETATIMIVEDEAMIRQIGADILEEAGYQVIEAATADEALNIIKANPGIALIFTDVRMPGAMDGLGLAAIVHERWPDVRLLITSGHCRLRNDEIPARGKFIPKPYPASELIRQIGQLLRRPEPSLS